MFQFLLAAGEQIVATAKDAPPDQIGEIHRAVVTGMPFGGLRLMLLLVGLTLVFAAYAAYCQWKLANNQVRIARMLQEHLAEHREK